MDGFTYRKWYCKYKKHTTNFKSYCTLCFHIFVTNYVRDCFAG
jgi:hypothetical protein